MDEDKLKHFIRELNRIRAGKRISVQSVPVSFDTIYHCYANRNPVASLPVPPGQQLPPPDTLWGDFYHFLSDKFNPATIRKRIYIHAVPPIETSAVVIMGILVGLLDKPGFMGLQEVKVAGQAESDRKDTIVAYLDDDAVVNNVLTELRKLPRGLFAAGVPNVVKELWPGVGVADEPSDVQLVGDLVIPTDGSEWENPDKHSFGMFLAKLLWWAVEATEPTAFTKEHAFLENFMMVLKVAQIDPMNPHLHAKRYQLEGLQKAAIMKIQALAEAEQYARTPLPPLPSSSSSSSSA